MLCVCMYVYVIIVDLAEVVAASLEYDISDFQIGQMFPVLCQVMTCVDDVQIDVLKADNIVDTINLSDAKVMTAQFNLLVSADLMGEHFCQATIIFKEMSNIIIGPAFNITGKTL